MIRKIAIYTGLAAAIFGAGFLTARLQPSPPPEQLPPLPPEVVTVEIVKEIKVPGPERVVERVKLVTQEKPVIKEVLRTITEAIEPVGRVRLDADKFKGIKDGIPAFGWKGHAICEVRDKSLGDTSPWLTLVDSPFDLMASKAEIVDSEVVRPARQSRLRLDLGVGAATSGLAYSAGASKRISHRSGFGRVLMPDWVGAQAVVVGSNTAVLVTMSKEF